MCLPPSRKLSRLQVYVDSVLVAEQKISGVETIRLDSKALPEGYHEVRFRCFSSSALRIESERVLTFNVDNTADEIDLSILRTEFERKDVISLRASATGAAGAIKLYQGTREVAQIGTSPAFFRVPAHRLGTGPIRLHAEVLNDNNDIMVSKPVTFTISRSE